MIFSKKTDVLDEDMDELFRRSVAQNHATGVPPILEITESVQSFDFAPVRQIEINPTKILDEPALGPGPPNLRRIIPTNGKTLGDSPVTIEGNTGSVFLSTAEVRFDNVLATNVVIVNSTTLTCRTPAHTVNTLGVDIKVTNIPGDPNSSGTLTQAFVYYAAPYITNIEGFPQSGATIKINGGNFYTGSGYRVMFNGIETFDVVPSSAVIGPPDNRFYTQLTVVVPAGIDATQDVEVIVENADFERQKSAPYIAQAPPHHYVMDGPLNNPDPHGSNWVYTNNYYQYRVTAYRADNSVHAGWNGGLGFGWARDHEANPDIAGLHVAGSPVWVNGVMDLAIALFKRTLISGTHVGVTMYPWDLGPPPAPPGAAHGIMIDIVNAPFGYTIYYHKGHTTSGIQLYYET